ncbi:MAG: type VI secretion system baseplate subunit TssE [Polyangiaceae bacterium]|nr:type VI secretion system baseplate subunit TssE [Polyangiaceae bacterium]
MAELTPKERLQPSLLDRLSDDEPDNTRESRNRRVLSPQRLRESVRRDLSWLLNNTRFGAIEDLAAYPEVERSTLNYGVPDLAGKTSSTVNVPELEKAIRAVILEFEPRLLRQTVQIKVVMDKEQMSHNALSFVIEAELWAQPLPLRVFLKTDVDLETGSVTVSEATRTD